MCQICPRCGSPMLESMMQEDHYECPACDLYLASWAFQMFAKAVNEQPIPAEASTEVGA